MKNVKERIRKILKEVNLDLEVTGYITYMVEYCIKKDIHELDINLEGELFPLLAKKHKLSQCAIKNRITRALKVSYQETDNLIYYKTLGYADRISTKKLLIVLIGKLKKEEDK